MPNRYMAEAYQKMLRHEAEMWRRGKDAPNAYYFPTWRSRLCGWLGRRVVNAGMRLLIASRGWEQWLSELNAPAPHSVAGDALQENA